jgi:hypothetical protein
MRELECCKSPVSRTNEVMSGLSPRPIIAAFACACSALALLATSAGAVTFDLSALDGVNHGTTRQPYYQWWTAPNGTGIDVFSQSGYGRAIGQADGWTLGTGMGQATLYEAGGGRGNNGFSGVYIPTGGPAFPIPAGQTIGQNNTQYTGFYAGANYTPYLWFGNPGSTSTTASGSSVFVNSLYVAGASSGAVTIYGYSDLGNSLIAGDVLTIPASSAVQQVVLNWAGVEQLSFVGGGGIYVNDIEVNDPLATPLPAALPLFASSLGAMGLLGLRRKRKVKAE